MATETELVLFFYFFFFFIYLQALDLLYQYEELQAL